MTTFDESQTHGPPNIEAIPMAQNETDKMSWKKKYTAANHTAFKILDKNEMPNATINSEKAFSTDSIKKMSPPMPHLFSHIPKTGGYYVFEMVNKLYLEYNSTVAACNLGSAHFFTRKATTKGKHCVMWMSERHYYKIRNHDKDAFVYTIVRNPKHHVLSQFFHCQESKDHEKRRSAIENVTLDQWLLSHARAGVNVRRRARLKKRFQCYDPFNLQWSYVESKDVTSNVTTFLTGNQSRSEIKQDLKDRYTVIGDQSQMGESICVIFIRNSGFVPRECNCSHTPLNRRRLSSDHGTLHHGATFQTSVKQDALIDALTENDMTLYSIAKEIFAEQAKAIEEEYQFNLCSKAQF
eukprot:CAMPEP_0178936228 /NCGR_PEP_ID=MMETSP0786-20121207/25053_1 /TAXON_ID=186022 /ORGANISM="Thalassionema frauenfeldii, Strain CCMP 1798" /LENGTH=351 /DNA_ID=CAMNT_0020614601 /DNA_START=113 /DNA_END=1168 /DNA_ORIENTATION=-